MALAGCAGSPEPPTLQCNDQIRNGDETDVDCGGGSGCRACKIDFATANAASNDLAVRLNTGQKQ
jgi:hypothetical protein